MQIFRLSTRFKVWILGSTEVLLRVSCFGACIEVCAMVRVCSRLQQVSSRMTERCRSGSETKCVAE